MTDEERPHQSQQNAGHHRHSHVEPSETGMAPMTLGTDSHQLVLVLGEVKELSVDAIRPMLGLLVTRDDPSGIELPAARELHRGR